MAFVELDRTFEPYSANGEVLSPPPLFTYRSDGLKWPDLLEKYRVVVIAEAYSGKSDEFRHIQEKLVNEGKTAFFIPIEELCDREFEQLLSPPELATFESWKNSAEDAYFFLDSIDEAKLKGKHFKHALSNLSKIIRNELDRSRIFVSSRPNDWKAISDDSDIEKWLKPTAINVPMPQTDNTSRDELLLRPILNDRNPKNESEEQSCDEFATTQCLLKPLDHLQRKKLIESQVVEDSPGFEREIGRFGLTHLATRPGDLLMLTAYWNKKNRCLDSRQIMCDHLIREKLSEKRSLDVLSDEKAFAGAKTVAAALTLGRAFSVLTADHELSVDETNDALRVEQILTDWSPAERDALLRRGLFIPYSFGKLRFYHREAQEFLCAKWFDDLIELHCPLPTIFELFFPEIDGIQVVNPTLKPVAAWLALWKPLVRDELNKREAAILIDHGDPGSLSPSFKASLLKSYVEQMNNGDVAVGSPFSRFENYSWLFADPVLASEIADAWNNATDDSLRIDLLRMIGEGRITECSNIAESVAVNPLERIGVRMLATNALVVCSAHNSLEKVASQLLAAKETTRADHAADLAVRLYGTHLTTSALFELVKTCPKPLSSVTDGFGYHLVDLWSKCPESDRILFVRSVTQLLFEPPFFSDYRQISEKYRFLARKLSSIANEFLKSVDLSKAPDEAFSILLAIARTDRFDSAGEDWKELTDIVRRNREFRRTLLWRDADFSRRQGKQDLFPNWFWQVPTCRLLGEFDESDIEWLKEDLANRPAIEEKQIALSALVGVFKHAGRLDSELPNLKILIGNDSRLMGDLESFTRPPDTAAEERMKELNERIAIEQEKHERDLSESWINFRDEITQNPKLLLDKEAQFDVIEELTTWLDQKSGERRRRSVAADWQFLKEVFSEEVANNFQKALKDLWRVTSVSRPKREGNAMTYLRSASQAFAGIGIEASTVPNWPSNLSEEDAAKASQIACEYEIEYPDWLDDLITHFPEQALPTVEKALLFELQSTNEVAFVLLQRFEYRQHEIPNGIAQSIVDVACRCKYGSHRRVDDITRIILRLTLTDSQKRKISQRVSRHVFDCNDETQVILKTRYFALWIAVDPANAISEFENWLAAKQADEAVQIAADFFGNCFGAHGEGALADYLVTATASELEQLLIVAATFIRIEEDSVHRPNTRDNAQRARDRLIEALASKPEQEHLDALRRLSANEQLSKYQHWLNRKARGVAEAISEFESWEPQEILRFERKFVSPIANAEALYGVVKNILANIQLQLDTSDASTKRLMGLLGEIHKVKKAVKKQYPKVKVDSKSSDEESVQNWLAEQLLLRSNGRFHVHREARVANKKMPDIVVSDAKGKFEIAIEIKQADSWKVNQLVEALEVQLAETYLLPDYRRHGILFMTNNGRKGWQHPMTGAKMTFDELIQYLTHLAEKKTSNAAGRIKVSVVGVDLTS